MVFHYDRVYTSIILKMICLVKGKEEAFSLEKNKGLAIRQSKRTEDKE